MSLTATTKDFSDRANELGAALPASRPSQPEPSGQQQVSSEASTASSGQRGLLPATGRDAALADELREAMVRRLRQEALIVSGPVAAVFRAVPRHLFAPGDALDAAYDAHGTAVPKRDADGLLLSVMSAPLIQAMMLEMAGIERGMRVHEVGSGGYNAALIAELSGRAGALTSIDIDPDVTLRTCACLDGAGYERVRVVTGDAEYGVAEQQRPGPDFGGSWSWWFR